MEKTTVATGISTYRVDPDHSQIGFRVRHLGFNKVAGKFSDYDVEVRVDPDDLSTLEASMRIRTESIDTGSSDRDTHLRSADFFEPEKWPEMTFQSTGVKDIRENSFILEGELDLHGVQKQIELKCELLGRTVDPWGNDRVAFEAFTTLNRKEFNLTWNQVLESGGLLVGENVEIVIELQLVHAEGGTASEG